MERNLFPPWKDSLTPSSNHQKQLYDEICSTLGDKEHVEYEDLAKLNFMEYCLLETLRMNPIFRTMRECKQGLFSVFLPPSKFLKEISLKTVTTRSRSGLLLLQWRAGIQKGERTRKAQAKLSKILNLPCLNYSTN